MIGTKERVASTLTAIRISTIKVVTITSQIKCSLIRPREIKICMVDLIMILAAIATMTIRVRPTGKKTNLRQTNDTATIVKKDSMIPITIKIRTVDRVWVEIKVVKCIKVLMINKITNLRNQCMETKEMITMAIKSRRMEAKDLKTTTIICSSNNITEVECIHPRRSIIIIEVDNRVIIMEVQGVRPIQASMVTIVLMFAITTVEREIKVLIINKTTT